MPSYFLQFLRVPYDDLGGKELSNKARKLILWLGRRHELDKLLGVQRQGSNELFSQAGSHSIIVEYSYITCRLMLPGSTK